MSYPEFQEQPSLLYIYNAVLPLGADGGTAACVVPWLWCGTCSPRFRCEASTARCLADAVEMLTITHG